MACPQANRKQGNMSRLNQYLTGKLAERKLAGNLRSLKTGREATDFFSNDYLGLATTGLLDNLIATTYKHNGTTGSTGSRLLSGNTVLATELEETIAQFHNAETALLFNSGYDANTGLVSAISDRHTTLLYDELCHASIIDGIRLSLHAGKYKFQHNDLTDLAEKLQQHKDKGTILVIAESVYSMDGDMAPLAAIAQLCADNEANLIVDEAHATGVFGSSGEGLVCHLGLESKVFARVHTFGKALGCHGAAVVGSALLKEFLINFSRQFIYTTALPPHSLQAIACAYQYLGSEAFTDRPLHDLIAYFREQVAQAGCEGWMVSHSPIQALVVGDNEHSKALASRLQSAGLQINAILSPTVPKGRERLRVCLHTFNTRQEIDRLIHGVKR